PLGQDFAAYVEPLYYDYRDLTVRHVKVTPDAVVNPDNPGSIEVKVLIQNRGTLPATNATVKLYWDQGSRGRVLVDERVVQTVTARCAQMHTVQLAWQPASLPLGYQVLVAEITPGS